ncbi:MAG: hypothetical protein CK424_01180 [Legionella sp.]|nr:MAG: hypothetical protein CK424_01180 [Legionella sp.]
MHIYADYIVPITAWLHHHPNYALVFTFLVALLESLAIIGTIIPGSLTMTAVGILAGSNVMRFDLTIAFASLGAFTGDSISYMLGAIYSESLASMWPFKRYPKFLNYGQDFFNRHGGKSVLIGRFTGPLRSIMPIIAGMMHMSRLQFFAANFISAIGWAILYLVPGYIIGAASHQLSAESAQRLFALVMSVLVIGWLLSLVLKILARSLNLWFATHVDTLWRWSKKNAYTKYMIAALSAQDDRRQQRIITFLLIWLCCVAFVLILSLVVIQHTWLTSINQAVCYFLQSLRTPTLDKILIFVNLMFHPVTLVCFCSLVTILAIYNRDSRFLKYWLSLMINALLITWLFVTYFTLPHSITLFVMSKSSIYPEIPLCIATALFTFLINYLLQTKPSHSIASYVILAMLFLSGFSTLYLGDNWLSSVIGAYGIGASVGLAHWIVYRRKPLKTLRLPMTTAIGWVVGIFLMTAILNYHHKSALIIQAHTPPSKQYTLNQDTWWYQDEPILPVYSTNRIGRRVGVFNVQYAGSIRELEKRLEMCGWRKQPKSFIYSLIIHAEGRYTSEDLPFMEQLYLNKHPALTMSYRAVQDDNLYILRLWRSNYHLLHYQDPIWLGNIILARKKPLPQKSLMQEKPESSHLFAHILPAVHDYQITRLPIKDPYLKTLPYEIPSEVLIIKN